MSRDILSPTFPESVSDGVLLEWKKAAGDAVARDEVLVEVETDKVVLEVAAPADGVLEEILIEAGASVTSGEVLARMQVGASDAPKKKPAQKKPAQKKPAAKKPAREKPAQAKPAREVEPPADDFAPSPAVRRLLTEHNLDAAQIRGSGKAGRITKEDVLAFIARAKDAPAAPAAKQASLVTPAPAATPAGARREPMSRLRQTIAARLVEAQQTAALLTTFNEVNMQPVVTLRSRHKESFEKKHGARLGFMSFFVKASVIALESFPLVNAYIDGDDIVHNAHADIGIAVSSPRGLVVPVLRDCASLSFAQIEKQIADFGVRARDGKITLNELSGGTFTITNGGVFGSLLSTPIVNPPQSAILGMHKIQHRPVAEDDTDANAKVVVRPMMYLAISYDHRIIDGKEAVQFLVAIKEALENPARLLLDI